jgi:hypothetical protein
MPECAEALTMPLDIRFFGQHGPHQIIFTEHGHETAVVVRRELWFDRDVDGHWLVGVKREAHVAVDGEGDWPEAVGAIVVRDVTAIAFIERLAQLLVDPAPFTDEPVFQPPRNVATEPTDG